MSNTNSDSKSGNFANDPERASEEGRKGGQQSHGSSDKASKSAGFADDPKKASEAGKKGGEHSHGSRKS